MAADGGQMYGADADALDALALRFEQSAAQLERAGQQLRAQLYNSPWRGVDADAFRNEWDSSHARTIAAAAGFLNDGGDSLKRNAREQRTASGTDGGPWSGNPGTLDTQAVQDAFAMLADFFHSLSQMEAPDDGYTWLDFLGDFGTGLSIADLTFTGLGMFLGSSAWTSFAGVAMDSASLANLELMGRPFGIASIGVTALEGALNSATDTWFGQGLSGLLSGGSGAIIMAAGPAGVPLALIDVAGGGLINSSMDFYACLGEGVGQSIIHGDTSYLYDDLDSWNTDNLNGDNGWVMQSYAQVGSAIASGSTDGLYEWNQANLAGDNGWVLSAASHHGESIAENPAEYLLMASNPVLMPSALLANQIGSWF